MLLVDGEGLDTVECDDRRVARAGRDDGELAEELAGTDDAKCGHVAERCRDPHRHVSLRHQVHRVARVAVVEDDLAGGEPSSSSQGQEVSTVRLGQNGEQR